MHETTLALRRHTKQQEPFLGTYRTEDASGTTSSTDLRADRRLPASHTAAIRSTRVCNEVSADAGVDIRDDVEDKLERHRVTYAAYAGSVALRTQLATAWLCVSARCTEGAELETIYKQ